MLGNWGFVIITSGKETRGWARRRRPELHYPTIVMRSMKCRLLRQSFLREDELYLQNQLTIVKSTLKAQWYKAIVQFFSQF